MKAWTGRHVSTSKPSSGSSFRGALACTNKAFRDALSSPRRLCISVPPCDVDGGGHDVEWEAVLDRLVRTFKELKAPCCEVVLVSKESSADAPGLHRLATALMDSAAPLTGIAVLRPRGTFVSPSNNHQHYVSTLNSDLELFRTAASFKATLTHLVVGSVWVTALPIATAIIGALVKLRSLYIAYPARPNWGVVSPGIDSLTALTALTRLSIRESDAEGGS